jgi:hypothetical protein
MAEEEFSASHLAEAYIYEDPDPSHLTPADVTKEIELLRIVQMWHSRYVLALDLIARRSPGFNDGPTAADARQFAIIPDPQTEKLLASARALTRSRLPPSNYFHPPPN